MSWYTELTDDLLAAQCFVFFVGGFETSSTLMSFALHELALNKDVQDKLHKEIKDVLSKNGGRASYEAIQEMVYLDRVICGELFIFILFKLKLFLILVFQRTHGEYIKIVGV